MNPFKYGQSFIHSFIGYKFQQKKLDPNPTQPQDIYAQIARS